MNLIKYKNAVPVAYIKKKKKKIHFGLVKIIQNVIKKIQK